MSPSASTAPPTAILPVADTRDTLTTLWRGIRRRPRIALSVPVLCLVTAVAAVIPSLALGVLVDRVTEHAPVSSLLPIAAVAGFAAVIGGLSAGASMHAIAGLGAELLGDIREDAVVSALHLRRDVFEGAGRGDLLSRVSNDVTAANRAVTTVLPTAVTAAALIAVSLLAMAGLDWRLGLAGATAVPLYVIALRWYLPRSRPVFAAERRAAAERSQVMLEAIGGRATIHVYANETRVMSGIAAASARTRDLSMSVFRTFTQLVGRANRAEFVGLGAILAVGFWLVSAGEVTVGATTAAALMFHRLFNPIGVILYSSADLQLASAGVARLIGVTRADRAASNTADASPDGDHAVTIAGLQFAYQPEKPVLRGIDLSIPHRTSLALVGASGAGKSTVAGILGGTLIAGAGTVRVPADARIFTVTQEVHIFAGPLVDDLRLAAPGATRARIRDALDEVGAAGWVDALPDGLDTVVGEGGHPLSDAHAQQIALARVILADPDIVILDEATAEAGSHHAGELEAAAAAAIRGRTALVVAHRLGQIRSADAVAVISDGVITEHGPPETLLIAGGPLAAMWSAWSREHAPAERSVSPITPEISNKGVTR